MSGLLSTKSKLSRFSAALLSLTFGIGGALVFQTPAQALTATVNAVSFKAPVFDSYNHATGGGAWNDGSVTYDKGELLGTNYRCGDVATFLLELNTSATPTKQPAPYKAQISVNYTWDSTGATGASLTALSSTDHLKTNTGVITKPSGATLGTSTNSGATAGVTAGWDGGFNAAGISARVATSPAPVVTNTGTAFVSGATPAAGDEFGGNTSTSNVTFVVENVNAGANIVVRSDAVIHCKPGASPTGNMQASLQSVKIIYPGAPEDISAGNQTVNFRGVGNLAGLGTSYSISKTISANGSDCSSTVSTATYSTPTSPQPVLYCYVIQNTGNVDITGFVASDNHAGVAAAAYVPLKLGTAAATTSPITIPAGATVTGQLTTNYTTGGTYTNTVTTTATNAPSQFATAMVIIGTPPPVSITKTQTSTNPSAIGDVISYSLQISVPAANGQVQVTDSNASSLTCNGTTWNSSSASTYGVTSSNINISGTTLSCTATHIVSATDASNGSVVNTASVSKSGSPSGNATSNTVTTPIVAKPLTYDLSVYKAQTSTTKPSAAGQTITYSIQVTNIGTGTLTSVGLSENLAGTTISGCVVTGTVTSVSLPLATLAPGASFTCTATHTVTSAEILAHSVTNTASATTTSTLTTPTNRNSNSVTTPLGSTPSLKIIKMQASQTGAGNTGQYPSVVGQVLNYAISVINDGNVDLTNVVVTDPNGASLTCASPYALATSTGVSLAAGVSFDCTAIHTVTAADLTAGQVTNVAYATGQNGSTTLNVQSSNIVTTAALKIVKSVRNITHLLAGYTKSDDTIDYDIVVTNTGSVTLNNIVVSDTNATGLSCPATVLTAGQSMTCTASHIVTSTETSAGVSLNTASVTTTEISAPINSNTVTTHLLDPNAAHVSIVKARTSGAPTKEGDAIVYSLTVTNDGNGSVDVTDVIDANALISGCTFSGSALTGTLTGTTFTLASAKRLNQTESIVCTATHTVNAADMRAGSVTNTASVHAAAVTGGANLNIDSNTVTDNLTLSTSLSVVKSYTSAAPTVAGDVISYRIVVTNTGTIALSNVSANDPLISNLSCPSTPSLNPGSSITCTGSYTVVSGDVTAGGVVNTASASGTDPYTSNLVSGTSNTIILPLTAPTPTPTPTPPAPLGPNPSMTVVKALTGTAPTKVGDTVGYTITVTNNGDIALAGVNVTDANATLGTCSVALPATLAVGASITCAATHVVTDADFKAGHVDNTAVASSTTGSLNRSSNVVTVPLSPVAGISIVKTLNGAAPSKIGNVITYKIVVTNTGNVSLTSTTVTDANAVLGTCSPAAPADLAPGATMTCAATHVVTAADMVAGKVDNIANVAASSVAGQTTGSSSSGSSSGSTGSSIAATSQVVTVPLNFGPLVAITKKQVGALPTAIGGFIYYTITVTNIGNVPLHDVTIKDDNATITSCTVANPVGALAVGDSYSCSAKHELTDADVLAGKVINIASVTSKENATASSGSSSTSGGSNASPGSVNVPSNQVLTIIRIASIRHTGVVVKPNGGTVTLGAAVLKNPKLNALAFTGDIDNVQSDASLFIAVLAALIGVLGFRRRALKK